ncbi:MAG: NAD(+) synthase [Bacteroidaceae bacterium]|nr:NAD(+) synthase [Bacteroidaceae bacterium]MBP5322170.1 NAD(+) synthase [Bacteroidaceae bacterium]
MKNYGFIRVAAAVPSVRVADVAFNVQQMITSLRQADAAQASLVVFPELGVTSYSCGDLFGQNLLVEEAEKGLRAIITASKDCSTAAVVGVPVRIRGKLYNCAAVIRRGILHGLVPKIYIPNYNEFYEARWFASGADFLEAECISFAGYDVLITPNQLFRLGEATIGVEICEDLWAPIPPSSFHTLAGADIMVNLSASDEVLMKPYYRKRLIANKTSRTGCAYVFCSCGYGESTQDVVFSGTSLIFENGTLLAEGERFSMEPTMILSDVDIQKVHTLRQKDNTFAVVTPDGACTAEYAKLYSIVEMGEAAETNFEKTFYRYVEPHPFVPAGDNDEIGRRASEITSIQVMGLAKRLQHVGCKTAVIGISGGLDSTLALLVTVLAFDKLGWAREHILGITMPGFGTTGRTHSNAVDLMKALGITAREISIVPAVNQHFADIGQDPATHDVTYENSQARERMQILMDIANKENGMVVGTGDLSELALGWATYNGDHMSMYGVNAGVPKTLVKYLVRWAALNKFSSGSTERSVKDILLDIVDTPISPELTPADKEGNIAQKTEDIVGPYELHDFFLYHFFRFGCNPSKVLFLAKKAFLGKESDSNVFVGPEGTARQYTEDDLKKWLKKFYWRFFSQQFKRSCLPDGPKVGSVSLSPRGDWRMPSDAVSALWIDDME